MTLQPVPLVTLVRRSRAAVLTGFLYSLSFLLSFLLLLPPYHEVFALPQGAQVEHGDVSIEPSGDSGLNVTASDQAIIRWDSFDIDTAESVQFLQPFSSATVLNRILGGQASQIAGQLLANGWVFLINPAGIVFAPTAVVNVGGLVASSLDLSNDAFLARSYQFIQPDGVAPGLVINRGAISTTADGGLIALLGAAVANEGTIAAQLGTVALASGSQVTLSFDPDGMVAVTVDAPTSTLVIGPDGQVQDGAVNAGSITAAGGTVLVKAAAINQVFDRVINQTGVIEAN